MRTQLETIAARNPDINALVYQAEKDSLLEQAQASDERRGQGQALSELDGISLAIKDNIQVAGMPTTAGLGLPVCLTAEDAEIITRARQAGMLLVGKLNMHEAALGATTANPHLGVCHHPLRRGYTPGGSSGGSGAWVGGGLGAAALGTDTLGSVRIPAAYCGVSGIKPTAGWVSKQGVVPVHRRLDTVGPLARSPADLLPLLTMLSGKTAPAGWPQKNLLWVTGLSGLDDEVAAHLTRVRKTLEADGYRLTPVPLALDFGAIRRAALLLSELEMLTTYRQLREQHPQAFSIELNAMLDWAEKQPDERAQNAEVLLADTAQKIAALFESDDWLLLPTTGQTAFAFDARVPAQQADYTALFSISGHPALSLPAGRTTGLPVGLQLAGRHNSDFALIAQAQLLFDRLNTG